jgi:hypothetical protein
MDGLNPTGGSYYLECTNEALACRPAPTRFGGPPERSEGGEGR